MPLHSRIAAVISIGLTALLLSLGSSFANEEKTWLEIRTGIIGQSILEEGDGRLTLTAPARAEDAAIVLIGVHIRLPESEMSRVTRLTLVVDENPVPIVGVFHMRDGRTAFDISTRVRIESYSFVRAIAAMDDGRMYMAKAYVKSAGGCSAPALKDPAEAKAHLGEMRFRVFADRGDAQVQVRHPNYSGLQMDQVTRLYTPAWFIERLDVRQGERMLFTLEGGISISEDPAIRFSYTSTDEPVTIEAKDNEGRVFKQTFPASGS